MPADLTTRIHDVFCRHRPLDLDTSFFEAGFSSELLAQVLSELRHLGLRLSLIDLYRHPTVRAVATAHGGRPTAVAAPPPWLRDT